MRTTLFAAMMAVYIIPASAQFTHAAKEDFNDHTGFTSLFDGKTLAGWDGDPSLWSVKDGSIYINPSCEHPTGTVYVVWQGGEGHRLHQQRNTVPKLDYLRS